MCGREACDCDRRVSQPLLGAAAGNHPVRQISLMTPSNQVKQVLPAMEFGKKMSVEKEIGRMGQAKFNNVVWDESGHFIIYASLLGIKIVNLTTQRVSRQLAQREHLRCLAVGLFQV